MPSIFPLIFIISSSFELSTELIFINGTSMFSTIINKAKIPIKETANANLNKVDSFMIFLYT